MSNENLSSWLGLPVKDFTEDNAAKPVTDGGRVIYRLQRDWDSKMPMDELFARFVANDSVREARAVIFGPWSGDDHSMDSTGVVHLLVGARDRLPHLKGIFIGDIISEQNEISWINQSDVSPVLAAYPNLEHFRVRGGSGLSLGGGLRHESLKSLVVETGGLGAEVVAEIASLDLPALENLEIWFGSDSYGGDAGVEDARPFLERARYPKLRRLALRNAMFTDDIAEALTGASVLDNLEDLDLSMGTLGDAGAEHLLKNEALTRLKSLDLSHHYCSDEMMAALRRKFPGVNLDEQETPDEDYRYVAVGE